MMVALHNMHVATVPGTPDFGIQLIVVACQCGTETEVLKYTMLTHSHNQKTSLQYLHSTLVGLMRQTTYVDMM